MTLSRDTTPLWKLVEYETEPWHRKCVFRPVSGPRLRPRIIAFVCSREVLFGWYLFGNEETAGPLRRGDKCIYVVNLPGWPASTFQAYPAYPRDCREIKGPVCSSLGFFGRSRERRLTADRVIVEHSIVLENNEVVDKYH